LIVLYSTRSKRHVTHEIAVLLPEEVQCYPAHGDLEIAVRLLEEAQHGAELGGLHR
jgi:hypothetical protein